MSKKNGYGRGPLLCHGAHGQGRQTPASACYASVYTRNNACMDECFDVPPRPCPPDNDDTQLETCMMLRIQTRSAG